MTSLWPWFRSLDLIDSKWKLSLVAFKQPVGDAPSATHTTVGSVGMSPFLYLKLWEPMVFTGHPRTQSPLIEPNRNFLFPQCVTQDFDLKLSNPKRTRGHICLPTCFPLLCLSKISQSQKRILGTFSSNKPFLGLSISYPPSFNTPLTSPSFLNLGTMY